MEYKKYIGKLVTIKTTDGLKYTGKMVELQGPDETDSGEVEIGINFAGGIRMFEVSEIDRIEICEWTSVLVEGDIGSEGGVVIADETYKESCRITLERCERYDAITCGVYGAMVHTTFANERESRIKYEAMKEELKGFLDRETTSEEENAFYEAFTGKY